MIRTVLLRVLRELKHDRRALALAFIAPLIVVLAFGESFRGGVSDVPVALVDMDRGVAGKRFSELVVERLENDSTVKLLRVGDLEGGLDLLRGGEVWAVIYFPPGFTEGVPRGNASLTLYLDASNPAVSDAVVASVRAALAGAAAARGFRQPLSLSVEPVYGAGATYLEVFVSGVVSFAVFVLSTLLTLLSFVKERVMGTLERLRASPLRVWEIMGGYSAAFSVLGSLQAVIILGAAQAFYGLEIRGNPFDALLVVVLLAVAGVNLGIALSALARTESQAILTLPIVTIPTFLLSGVFWPLEAMPPYMRAVSRMLPATYAVDALRSVVLRGWGLGDIASDLAALAVFIAVFMALGVAMLGRKE